MRVSTLTQLTLQKSWRNFNPSERKYISKYILSYIIIQEINKQNVCTKFPTLIPSEAGDCTEHAETQVDHEAKAEWGYGRFLRDHIYSSELPPLKTAFHMKQMKLHEYRISRYHLCIGFLALGAH